MCIRDRFLILALADFVGGIEHIELRLDTLNRVDQLLESIIPLLEGAQHSGTTVTLPAEHWRGRAQTVTDNILLADEKYWYIVCADADCFMAVSERCV